MRSLKALHTIPAHKSNVSDIKFFRQPPYVAGQDNDYMGMEMEEDVKPVIPAEGVAGGPPPNGDDVKPIVTPTSSVPRNPRVDSDYKSGLYFVSAGYDGLVKLWSADDWHLIKAMSTDAGKVMSVDISSDGSFIASGSWNRSYQLFAGENVTF